MNDLGNFFSLIGDEKKKKEEEKKELIGETSLSDLFVELKEEKKKVKEKKKVEEEKKKELIGEITLDSLFSSLTELEKQEKEKEKQKEKQIEQLQKDVKIFESLLFSEPKKKEIVEESTSIELSHEEVETEEEEELEKVIEENDTVDHSLKILDTIKPKENLIEQSIDPEILKIRRELEYLKNLVNAQGGGGEVRLEFLDDVDRDTVKVDGKILAYQESTGKFIGVTNSGSGGNSGYANTAGIATVAQGLTGIPDVKVGIATVSSVSGFSHLSAPFGSTTNINVTVGSKDATHRYQGTGSGSAYILDGSQSPFLTLTPGRTYRFNLSSSDQSSHPFRFFLDAAKTTAYTTNVSTASTYTEIIVTDSTPTILHYQCAAHGYMGNSIQVNSSNAVKLNSQTASYYLDYNNFTNTPAPQTVPTNNNQLTNGAGYITNSSNITGTSAGLSGSPSITVTDITATGDINVAGVLTYEDVTNVDSIGIVTARSGIVVSNGDLKVGTAFTVSQSGIVTAVTFNGSLIGSASSLSGLSSSFLLDYNNFTNIPTIPTNNNELTNGAGYITGVSTFSGNYNHLTNTPTIPTNNNELTNGAGYITTSFTNTNQLTNGAGYVTSAIINSLDASNLSSGTIPDARFPAALPALDGSALTGITAAGTGAIGGLTIKNESGVVVGTGGSISTIDFAGSSNVTVTATSGAVGIATIAIAGITTTNVISETTTTDSLNVTGISTLGNINLSGNVTSNVTIVSTDTGSSAAPEFKLYRNSSSPANADYLGQIKFAGESDTGVERNYAKITGKIKDASNGTEDGILEFAHIKDGSQNISGRWNSDTLQLINGTSLTVAGDLDVSGNITGNLASSNLDVTGIATVAQAFYMPQYTTNARDGATFAEGAMIFNTTTKTMQYWNGTAWINLDGSGIGIGLAIAIDS